MKKEELLEFLRKQSIPFEELEMFKSILEGDEMLFIMIDLFNYGVICGKRSERIKKDKNN